ncbi:MAG: phage tail tape measure protein, partial [Sphingomonas sp.]|nr:phage tail tape measure protein [Sphingomonas sp.]
MISFAYQATAENFLRTTAKVEQQLGTLEKSAGGFGTVMKGALLGVGFVAVEKGIQGVGAAFAGSIGAASTFEKTMSGVKAVSGATGEEMRLLSGLALQLGKDTSFSASEAALGIEELIKGGVAIPDIMNGGAQSMLALAAAGGVKLPEAAEIAANAMAIFGIKGEGMAHVADMIAGAANASSLDVNDFKFAMAASGSVAAMVGQDFDDLAVAIAVMGQNGLKGSDAGTSLKTFLSNLQPTTKAQTAAMNELGLITLDAQRHMEVLRNYGIDPTGMSIEAMNTQLMQSVTGWNGIGAMTEDQAKTWKDAQGELDLYSNAFVNADGSFKSMAEIAGILQDKTSGLTDAQKMLTLETIFGSDAIRAAGIFAKSGSEGFAAMAGSMGEVTAAAVGAEKLNNTAGSIEQLKGSLETAGIVIGQSFLPMGRALIDWGVRAVNAAIPLLETYGPVLATKVAEGGKAIQSAAGILGRFGEIIRQSVLDPISFMLDLDPGAWGGGFAGTFQQIVATAGAFGEQVRRFVLDPITAMLGLDPGEWGTGFGEVFRQIGATVEVVFGAILPLIREVGSFIIDNFGTIARVVGVAAAAFVAFQVISTIVGIVTWVMGVVEGLAVVFGLVGAAITGGGGV